MSQLFSDLRVGLRGLQRQPAFALVAAATLALGIGASATVFSLVNGVLLRPLPYPAADALYLVQGADPAAGIESMPLSYPNFLDAAQTPAFSGAAASKPTSFNLTQGPRAERIEGARVSPGLLRVLGIRPLLGRDFIPADAVANGPDVALLTHALWQSRFGGDRGVVGRTIGLDGKRYLVAGILPPRFAYPEETTQLWIPYQPGATDTVRGANSLRVVGRLRPGVPVSAAVAQLDTIGRRLEKAYPDTNAGVKLRLRPLREELVGKASRALWTLQAAALLLLGIACVNVANLLLVRAAGRRQEVAIRCALGAGRGRIVRQFLAESLLLAAAGGILGTAAAAVAVSFLRRLPAGTLPRATELSIDPRVLLFSAAVSAATALLFGITPAWRAAGRMAGEDLKSGRRGATRGKGDQRTLRVLVVAEVALALLLTAGAGLLLESFLRLKHVRPGFEPRGLWTASVGLAPSRYPDTAAHVRYYREAIARLESTPGVASAAVVGRIPLANFSNWTSYLAQGHPVAVGNGPNADYVAASPGYFATMRIARLSGRGFSERDDADAPRVILVNRALARQEWPGEDPIGKRLQLYTDGTKWREVVGVVENVSLRGLDQPANPTVFVPLAQNAFAPHLRSGAFLVRFRGNEAAGARSVRETLAALDPEQAVSAFRPMEEVVSDSLSPRRLNLALTLVFGALAALLAAVGIYGVMANAVASRRQEIGVRMALGASSGDVLRLILREGAILAGAGIIAGLLAAVPGTRMISGLLFGVAAGDPAVFALVAALVFGISAGAVAIPAFRAAAVDPVTALQG